MSETNKKLSRNKYSIKVKNSTGKLINPPISWLVSSLRNYKTAEFKKKSSAPQNLIHKNLKKYSITKVKFANIIINTLVDSKNSHLVAKFKDFLIFDFIDEFLRRHYYRNESYDRLPKFAGYYKNYLTFFCKPTFRNFKCNSIVQEFGEAKAELYYHDNYGKKKKNKKSLINEKLRTIFSSTVKEEIDNSEDITYEQGETLFLSENSRFINENINSIDSTLISIINDFSFEKKVAPIRIKINTKNKSHEKIQKKSIDNPLLSGRLPSPPLIQVNVKNQNLNTNIYNKKFPNQNAYSRNKPKPLDNQMFQYKSNPIAKPKKKPTDINLQLNKLSPRISSNIDNLSPTNKQKHHFHLKTISPNFHSSIYAYNKIIKHNSPQLQNKKPVISLNSKKPLNKPTGKNLNLDNLVKLSIKLCKNKSNNYNNVHNRSNSISNQQYNSTPTINNFNININNHICLNNNNSQSNYNSTSNTKENNDNKSNVNAFSQISKKFSRNHPKILVDSTQTERRQGKTINKIKDDNMNYFLTHFLTTMDEDKKKDINEILSSRKISYHRKLSSYNLSNGNGRGNKISLNNFLKKSKISVKVSRKKKYYIPTGK